MGKCMKKTKIQNRYIYRWLCTVLLCLLATVMFFAVWVEFVVDHNQTSNLTGWGNLGMAAGIYIVLY